MMIIVFKVVYLFLCFSRQTTLAVYFMSLVGMIVFAATLSLGHLWVVFITAGVLGYSFVFECSYVFAKHLIG